MQFGNVVLLRMCGPGALSICRSVLMINMTLSSCLNIFWRGSLQVSLNCFLFKHGLFGIRGTQMYEGGSWRTRSGWIKEQWITWMNTKNPRSIYQSQSWHQAGIFGNLPLHPFINWILMLPFFSDLKCSSFSAIIRNKGGQVMAAMVIKGPYAGAAWCIWGPKAKINYLVSYIKLLLINMNHV